MPILALCGEETRAEGHDTEMRDFFFLCISTKNFPMTPQTFQNQAGLI